MQCSTSELLLEHRINTQLRLLVFVFITDRSTTSFVCFGDFLQLCVYQCFDSSLLHKNAHHNWIKLYCAYVHNNMDCEQTKLRQKDSIYTPNCSYRSTTIKLRSLFFAHLQSKLAICFKS